VARQARHSAALVLAAGVCFLLGVAIVAAVAPTKSTLRNPVYWAAAAAIAAAASSFTLALTHLSDRGGGWTNSEELAGRRYVLPDGWEGTLYDAKFGPDGSYRWGFTDLFSAKGERRETGVLIGNGRDCRLIVEATAAQLQPQTPGGRDMDSAFGMANTVMELNRKVDALTRKLQAAETAAGVGEGPAEVKIDDVMGEE
jgi:hypothetical protein